MSSPYYDIFSPRPYTTGTMVKYISLSEFIEIHNKSLEDNWVFGPCSYRDYGLFTANNRSYPDVIYYVQKDVPTLLSSDSAQLLALKEQVTALREAEQRHQIADHALSARMDEQEKRLDKLETGRKFDRAIDSNFNFSRRLVTLEEKVNRMYSFLDANFSQLPRK